MTRELAKAEREAAIVDALRPGPLRVMGIAVIMLPGDGTRPSRSLLAQITQSLRVLEREGIVVRAKHTNRSVDWRLAR